VALLLVPGPCRGLLARLRRAELWAFLLPPLLVVAVLGAINLAHGQYVLPNSVLAKSGLGSGAGLAGYLPSLDAVIWTLGRDLQASALLAVAGLYLILRRLRGAQSGLWLAWLVMAGLHVLYARFGWYERYQGYIVISGTLLALRTLSELRVPRRAVVPAAAALVLLLLPFPKLGLQAGVADAAHGIYSRQYQLGRLLAGAYDGRAVLVNDIGEVSWQHRGPLDDIWALGSYDILRAYRTGHMDDAFVAQIAARDGVRVAAVYRVLHGYIPDSWVEVASWSTPGAQSHDDMDIVFYAPDAASAATLRENLHRLAPTLPDSVQQVMG
jgi:hypothetical protein